MNSLDLYDCVRITAAAISLVSLFFLCRRAYRFWPRYTSYLRDMWFLLVGFQILLIESCIESIIDDVEGGPRIILSLLLSFVCLRVTSAKDRVFLQNWEEVSKMNLKDEKED